ncbi:hypothetical protein F3K46_05355 [Thermoanaerobacterium thermosaccharolyticum]|nr:hypothetical protein [Thermoanaerobacterium thermosaccharolyticum]MBE0228497.1 hypothetical protein [Thermoanaerobacterium thermosaccharolyticum]
MLETGKRKSLNGVLIITKNLKKYKGKYIFGHEKCRWCIVVIKGCGRKKVILQKIENGIEL